MNADFGLGVTGAFLGKLHFSVGAYTGWDWLASKLLPQRQLRLRVARKIFHAVRTLGGYEGRLTFSLPDSPSVIWGIGKLRAVVLPAWLADTKAAQATQATRAPADPAPPRAG